MTHHVLHTRADRIYRWDCQRVDQPGGVCHGARRPAGRTRGEDSMNAVSQGGLSHQPIPEWLIERVKADGVELVS